MTTRLIEIFHEIIYLILIEKKSEFFNFFNFFPNIY